jgi:hypothetical protein
MGSAYGETSPASFPHDCFYAEAVLSPGAILPLDAEYDERAVFLVSGRVDIAGQTFEPGQLLVFKPGDRISILAETNSRLMVLGGETMDGPRHIWWNFVSSSKDRIEAAKDDWKRGRFAIVPGDETEFSTLPEYHYARNERAGMTSSISGQQLIFLRRVVQLVFTQRPGFRSKANTKLSLTAKIIWVTPHDGV